MIMAAGVEVGKRGETQLQLLRRRDLWPGTPLAADRRVFQLRRAAAGGAQANPAADGAGGRRQVHHRQHAQARAGSTTRRTEAGAVYAIRGCPMHEEPLHLIPESLRADFEREYGIYIEGDLCPRCRYELEHTWEGHIERVPVRAHRVQREEARWASARSRRPTPRARTFSELVGSIDLSTIGEVRLGERSARLSLRRRAEHRQPRHDGVHRDAQGGRAVPLRAADAVAGAEHQDRAASA